MTADLSPEHIGNDQLAASSLSDIGLFSPCALALMPHGRKILEHLLPELEVPEMVVSIRFGAIDSQAATVSCSGLGDCSGCSVIVPKEDIARAYSAHTAEALGRSCSGSLIHVDKGRPTVLYTGCNLSPKML